MEERFTEHSIRFITSSYRDLFRIPDGGTIRVTFPDRSFIVKCRYIDDYHTQVNNSVYHICEFAEILERGSGTCEPEPELLEDRAAWQIGGKDYLVLERTKGGFRYEILTKDFLSKTQGHLDDPSWSMIWAREHVLETTGSAWKSRSPVSFHMVRQRMGEVLKASDVTDIKWISSRYSPGTRSAEHDLSCEINGERRSLTYVVSRHDEGDGFVIRSDGEDIWDVMPEPELRKLESVLSGAVEFGHWMEQIDNAGSLEEVRDVRYGLFEAECLPLTAPQIGQIHAAIDLKEEALLEERKRETHNEIV